MDNDPLEALANRLLVRIFVSIGVGALIVAAIRYASPTTLNRLSGVVLLVFAILFVRGQANPRGFAAEALRTAAFTGPIVVYVSTLELVHGTPSSDSFFEVSAQVIPVLLLALLVEGRIMNRVAGRSVEEVVLVLSVVMLLALGEEQALQGIWRHGSARADWIAGALASGIFGIVLLAALPEAREWESSPSG